MFSGQSGRIGLHKVRMVMFKHKTGDADPAIRRKNPVHLVQSQHLLRLVEMVEGKSGD